MNDHGLIPPHCFCALSHAQIASQTKCLSLEYIITLWYHHDDTRHCVCLLALWLQWRQQRWCTLHVFLDFCITFWTFPFYSLHSLSIFYFILSVNNLPGIKFISSFCSTLTITFLWLPDRTGGRTKTFIHNLMWLLFCFLFFYAEVS